MLDSGVVMRKPRRVSGVTLLAAAVLVLLPALAWLQYSWLEQIADADRDRRTRTLQTAATQLAQDFDGEIGKAVFGLQIEPTVLEELAWTRYAERYQVWADNAITPDIVKAIYLVDIPNDAPGAMTEAPPLRVWNSQSRAFDAVPWPSELDAIKTRFLHDGHSLVQLQVTPGPRRGERGERGFQRLMLPPTPIGDEQTAVAPIMRVTFAESAGTVPSGPPDVKLLGFTIIRLNTAALAQEVLPLLVRRHLDDDRGHSDFHVAVVARDDPSRVLFESEAGAAAAARANPDTTIGLLGSRGGPFLFMSRDGRRGRPFDAAQGKPIEIEREQRRGPPPPLSPPPGKPTENVVVNVFEARKEGRGATIQRTAALGTTEAHWQLVAKHRAGSLEAAVAAARTRNFALSSGILALLAAAIGLIVVSARRADRLARQQLEFVAAVSHELRTPVSVIGAAAGNLADGVVDEPGRVKKYGATIQAEARRLGETVERVLQLAGLAAGRAASGVPIPVPSLIEAALAASRHDIEAAGATVTVEIAPDVLHMPTDPFGVQRVLGDATALGSALQNLISNAIKYGGDTHWVRVTASKTADGAAQITVEDRGLGISAEDKKHIFEPFYRGREAVSRQIQGSGLGLHLVSRIIAAHGGRVSVDSEPRQGSRFTIVLPTLHDIPSRRTRATHEAPAAARS